MAGGIGLDAEHRQFEKASRLARLLFHSLAGCYSADAAACSCSDSMRRHCHYDDDYEQ